MKVRCFLRALFLVVLIGPSLRAEVTLTTLYSFTGGSDGAAPSARLVKGADGNFYGTTTYGGIFPGFFGNGNGTIFRISADGTFTNLYAFTGGNDGANPAIDLAQGNDGNFYGTAQFGGSENFGTVFRITPSGSFTTLAALPHNNSGMGYVASVTQGVDGNFYGTIPYFGPIGVDYGGPGVGMVFKMSPDGVISNLFSFDGTNGAYPQPGLALGVDGKFYGTTFQGGTSNLGIVFRISTNGVFTSLHSFTGGADGANPYAGLSAGNDGEIYGTTQSGGPSNCGTLFKITTNGLLSTAYSFKSLHGTVPYPPVAEGEDGTLYGMITGGYLDPGKIYQVSTNGVYTVLLYFKGVDGASPVAGLVSGNDGRFYGTTTAGGSHNAGTVFSLSASLQPIFRSVTKTGDTIELRWSALVGQTYQLQYKSSLSDTNWQNAGDMLNAAYDTMTNYDSITPGTSQRFYRIVLMQ